MATPFLTETIPRQRSRMDSLLAHALRKLFYCHPTQRNEKRPVFPFLTGTDPWIITKIGLSAHLSSQVWVHSILFKSRNWLLAILFLRRIDSLAATFSQELNSTPFFVARRPQQPGLSQVATTKPVFGRALALQEGAFHVLVMVCILEMMSKDQNVHGSKCH